MRCLATFVAIVLCLVMSQLIMAQKNICIPIKINDETVNPNVIPIAYLADMTNRGAGNFTVGISICTPTATARACNTTGFVTISNATNCLGVFDTAMTRPTGERDGFKVKYGSTSAKSNDAEAMILCNPFSKKVNLETRSKKFAALTPNKLGGTTYMMVLFSHAACSGRRTTEAPSSDLPSGGSSDFPSGGSGSSGIPSGGSGSSGLPSGGSGSSNMPSGGSGDYPSGSQTYGPPDSGSGPNSGDNSNIPIPPLPPGPTFQQWM